MQLLLDTDIGTDVDDALALAVLLGSSEIEIVGITTVYGDTVLRARLAARLVGLARPGSTVPIVPGERQPRSGGPIFWPGHEGELYDDLHLERIDDDMDAVAFLTKTALRYRGELDILAIGPLTNIAAALDRDPGFSRNVRRVIIMGGDFSDTERQAEHNIVSDIAAAQRVFGSDLAITVGGLDLTTQIRISQVEVDRIADSGPLGEALQREIERFWQFLGQRWNTPHDPILALWRLDPDHFSGIQASIDIGPDGKSDHDATEAGTATILKSMNVEAVAASMVERICATGRTADPTP